MGDLKLNPLTGDLATGPSGDLILTDDTTGETTAQLLAINLKTILGEWFLNTQWGLDYFGTIFVKNPNLAAVETAIRDVITGASGVAGIVSYQQNLNRATRSLSVSGAVQTTQGITVPFGVTLGPS